MARYHEIAFPIMDLEISVGLGLADSEEASLPAWVRGDGTIVGVGGTVVGGWECFEHTYSDGSIETYVKVWACNQDLQIFEM